MTFLSSTPLTPTLDVWLCAALVAFALAVPYAVITVDRLLAHQPDWMRSSSSMKHAAWPRMMAGLGGALLLAAFVTLTVLCGQLAA